MVIIGGVYVLQRKMLQLISDWLGSERSHYGMDVKSRKCCAALTVSLDLCTETIGNHADVSMMMIQSSLRQIWGILTGSLLVVSALRSEIRLAFLLGDAR